MIGVLNLSMAGTQRMHMRKLLIFITIIASTILSACSTVGDGLSSVGNISKIIPNALDKAPLIYRPTIQQGNVITQEQVNKLKPGMAKRQVKFVLGSSTLKDVFHANRWDYAYSTGIGSTPDEIKHLSIYFDNDRLVRITGDMHPQPPSEQSPVKKETVVKVPDWESDDKSLFEKTLSTVGIDTDK